MSEEEWMDDAEAATELRMPVGTVRRAVDAGELPGVNILGEYRINRNALREMAIRRVVERSDRANSVQSDGPSQPASGGGTEPAAVPLPTGLSWANDLQRVSGFDYQWPQKRTEYGTDAGLDHYSEGWEGQVILLGQCMTAKVGIGERYGRGRMTVFLDGAPQCEFTETIDGQGWASVVKPNGRNVLAAGHPIPPLFQRCRLVPYRDVTGTRGLGVPKGFAVLIASADYRSAVHAAAARWLGKRGHALSSAV